MAVMDDTGSMRRLAQALQSLRGADVIEVRGEWAREDAARAVVLDFVQIFELDVAITDLEDGFRIELRNRPKRTIRLDL